MLREGKKRGEKVRDVEKRKESVSDGGKGYGRFVFSLKPWRKT